MRLIRFKSDGSVATGLLRRDYDMFARSVLFGDHLEDDERWRHFLGMFEWMLHALLLCKHVRTSFEKERGEQSQCPDHSVRSMRAVPGKVSVKVFRY